MLKLIAKLNKDDEVHGILVQLPLPPQIDKNRVLLAVSPAKDVDAFHPENVGRLVQGRPRFLPCTPQGVQQLLVRSGIEIAGRHVVILGRSEIVGRPLSIMLSQHGPGGDATVTLCHSRTRDLPSITRLADILIAAIGRPKFVTAEMVKPGAAVVDVGINRTDEGVVGDVDFEAVARGGRGDHAGARRRRAADDRDAAAQHAVGGAVAGNVRRCQSVRSRCQFAGHDIVAVSFDLRAENVILIGRCGPVEAASFIVPSCLFGWNREDFSMNESNSSQRNVWRIRDRRLRRDVF